MNGFWARTPAPLKRKTAKYKYIRSWFNLKFCIGDIIYSITEFQHFMPRNYKICTIFHFNGTAPGSYTHLGVEKKQLFPLTAFSGL